MIRCSITGITTSESQSSSTSVSQAALGVELPPEHDGGAEQHRQREVRPAPGVEQRRGDVRAPARPQRQPRQQGGRRPRCRPRCAGAPLGVPVVPEVRMMIRLCFSGAVRLGGRALRDQRLEGAPRRRSGRRPRPSDPLARVGLVEELGELLVVHDDLRLLALQHVDELGTGEGGVQVEDVGAELGGGDARVDEAAVVAAHDRDGVTGTDAVAAQGVGEPVAALVQLPIGQLAELVDDRRAGRGAGSPSPRSRRPGPVPHRAASAPTRASFWRRVEPDDAGGRRAPAASWAPGRRRPSAVCVNLLNGTS